MIDSTHDTPIISADICSHKSCKQVQFSVWCVLMSTFFTVYWLSVSLIGITMSTVGGIMVNHEVRSLSILAFLDLENEVAMLLELISLQWKCIPPRIILD